MVNAKSRCEITHNGFYSFTIDKFQQFTYCQLSDDST